MACSRADSVILEEKDFQQWERGDANDAAALMRPANEAVLWRWPVSKRVNSSRMPDDDPSLIAIEGGIATSGKVFAATIDIGRELGQFEGGIEPELGYPPTKAPS